MTPEELKKLRYPAGEETFPENVTAKDIQNYIREIEELPANLRKETEKLTDEQLDTPYRDGGWTIRQVVHHLPDSHMNAYIRFKVAVTEDNPTIKPYFEDRWGELGDAKHGPIDVSLDLLEDLHKRWVLFLKSLKPEQFKRTFYHPENNRTFTLDVYLSTYAWHCRHHLAHITELKKRKGWK